MSTTREQQRDGVTTRYNADGSLDEVCAPGIHLEQMSNTHWWMRVGPYMINLHSKQRITANIEYDPLPRTGGRDGD